MSTSGQRDALKAIFAWLVPDADELRWVRFVSVFDEVGRYILDLPQLKDDADSIFSALDGIAIDIEKSREALVEAGTVVREAFGDPEPVMDQQAADLLAALASEGVHTRGDLEGLLHSSRLPEPVAAVPSPVEEAPPRVDRGSQANASESLGLDSTDSQANDSLVAEYRMRQDALAKATRRYAKPYTSKDIAAFYSTHTKVQTAAEFGISVATVSRRVSEWERESGTKTRPDLPPHTPLRAAEAIEQSRDREQDLVRQAAAEIKAREPDLVSKNVAEMDEFMARRKANVAAQANAAMEARRKAT